VRGGANCWGGEDKRNDENSCFVVARCFIGAKFEGGGWEPHRKVGFSPTEGKPVGNLGLGGGKEKKEKKVEKTTVQDRDQAGGHLVSPI